MKQTLKYLIIFALTVVFAEASEWSGASFATSSEHKGGIEVGEDIEGKAIREGRASRESRASIEGRASREGRGCGISEEVADIIENGGTSTYLAETDNEVCVPRQVSFASSARVQGKARRTENVQRQSFEFVRSGKIINPAIRYFIQKKSINNHSSLSDPADKLARLGKLII